MTDPYDNSEPDDGQPSPAPVRDRVALRDRVLNPLRDTVPVTRRHVLATAAAALATVGTGAVSAQQTAPQLAGPAPIAPGPARRPPPAPAALGQPIEITSRAFPSFGRVNGAKREHGRLEFRGGLVLTSPVSAFGGWSGIVTSDDGRRLMMISDRASWLSGEIQYDGNRPVRLASGVMGEIPGTGGAALRGRDRDAEALTLLDGTLARGSVLIAFERNHRIGRYPINERGLGTPAGFLKMPGDSRRMSTNKGLEAVCAIRSGPLRGSILAFAEEFHDEQKNHTGWIWLGGIGAEPQRIGLTNRGDFAVTDLAALPDGNLVVLERKFRWLEGVKMRLRLVRASTVRPGAMLDGEVLLEADMSSEIDNMEGLAVSRDARGQTVLTLVSDNNFNSMLQRTILLQFALAPETATRAPVARP